MVINSLSDILLLSHSRYSFATSASSGRIGVHTALVLTTLPTYRNTAIPLITAPSLPDLCSPRPTSFIGITVAMSSRTNKATMHELKLRRILEHNHRLREELARPRANVSVASMRWARVGVTRLHTGGHGSQLVQLRCPSLGNVNGLGLKEENHRSDADPVQLDQLLSPDQGSTRTCPTLLGPLPLQVTPLHFTQLSTV